MNLAPEADHFPTRAIPVSTVSRVTVVAFKCIPQQQAEKVAVLSAFRNAVEYKRLLIRGQGSKCFARLLNAHRINALQSLFIAVDVKPAVRSRELLIDVVSRARFLAPPENRLAVSTGPPQLP